MDRVPDLIAFARALTPAGSASRAIKQLYLLLSSCQPDSELPERVALLERVGKWVCHGPKPPPAEDSEPAEPLATTRLRLLLRALAQVSVFRMRFSAVLGSVFRDTSALRLLCEVGLPNQRGLWEETSNRLSRRLLPTPPDHGDLAELVAGLFRAERDADWLATIPASLIAELFVQVGDVWRPLQDATEDALALLTTRVSALGLSEDIRVRGRPCHVRESPFFKLPHAEIDELSGLLSDCRRDIAVVFENLERFGVSVDVVYRLEVIVKCIERIEAIIGTLDPRSTPELLSAETRFVAKLVRARIREGSIRDLVRSNLGLLARKVIERAGETGEHYITSTRSEWFKMLASAGGGGFLTAFTCVGKFLTKWGHFAPAIDGALSSVNYASSFVLMQFMGFTLATKQPSMTAAALAGSIREQPDEHQLDDLVTTIARICRSQLAAALGNIGIVIPAAIVFDIVYTARVGHTLLDPEAAKHTIESFHPLQTGTIAFAALTGVLLWLSSLGAGWLENWAVYRRIPEAIAEHRAKRLFGRSVLGFFSRFFRKHVAGFGGSVALGILLGMVPAFGTFVGLPLEVRHVTLSTGSLVFGVRALGPSAAVDTATLWAALGIVLIGVMNFGVSFLLALGVAFRARDVPTGRGLRLFGAVLVRFVRSPLEFVFPPASETGVVFSHRPSIVPSGRR